MKRSLAPPRRDKPTGGDPNAAVKKPPTKPSEERSVVNDNKQTTTNTSEMDHQDRIIAQKFQQRYRNKNLNILPTQMLVALSALTTLDISYNKLSDSQIELILNSCTKLSTFCIQGNLTNLIPASIWKLKALVNFRHDWVKLNPDDMYEPEKRLQKIKEIATMQQCLTRINKILGIDFIGYCQIILEVSFDQKLHEKIDRCQCSAFAKQNMLVCFDQGKKGTSRRLSPADIDNRPKDRSISKKKDPQPIKRQPIQNEISRQVLSQTSTTITRGPEIRQNIEKSPPKYNQFAQQTMIYFAPGFPLHNLFANFDKNHYAPAEIDGLLLRGYNPNLYDPNGLSPYHLCILQNQRKGIQYMLEISSNNPGFFDLEMPSIKEGKNVLHYSVTLRNYLFTKLLIDFGLPVDKRDAEGARLIHHTVQNIEFLILLRKLLRKRTHVARSLSALTIPPIPHQNKRNYIKHPQRQKQESRFRITYSRNDKLLQMFQAAAGIPNIKV